MNLLEHQGKELLHRFGIPVPAGGLARTPREARRVAARLGGAVVVKAQVLTGGRGRAGGITMAATPDEAAEQAAELLGMTIGGYVVRTLWIEVASEIAREYYLSLMLDRSTKQPLFMLNTSGGVDVEEAAAARPQAPTRLHVRPLIGFRPFEARRLLYGAGIEDVGERTQIASIIERLYAAFVGCDALLCEINPLAVTTHGEVPALDAKVTIDDYALSRHPDIAAMYDPESEAPQERVAHAKGISYVKLDGEVGILGYGAGLVMSTLDLIVQAGGRPANFCDLGGGGDPGRIVDAFEVVTADPQVRSIISNVFGGITRCDHVAGGILAAFKSLRIAQPVVVRLDGTNAAEGRSLLANAGISNLTTEPTMLEAARRAVELVGEVPIVWSEVS